MCYDVAIDRKPRKCKSCSYNLWCIDLWNQIKKALLLVKDSFGMICSASSNFGVAVKFEQAYISVSYVNPKAGNIGLKWNVKWKRPFV